MEGKRTRWSHTLSFCACCCTKCNANMCTWRAVGEAGFWSVDVRISFPRQAGFCSGLTDPRSAMPPCETCTFIFCWCFFWLSIFSESINLHICHSFSLWTEKYFHGRQTLTNSSPARPPCLVSWLIYLFWVMYQTCRRYSWVNLHWLRALWGSFISAEYLKQA